MSATLREVNSNERLRMATFEDSDFDVVGVSWTSSPAEATRRDTHTTAARLGEVAPASAADRLLRNFHDRTLQGNLDPHLSSPWAFCERASHFSFSL